MPKNFIVGIGGRAMFFSSKRSYLKWAVSTRDGWKHLMLLPVFALLWVRWLRVRKDWKEDLEKMRESQCTQLAREEKGDAL